MSIQHVAFFLSILLKMSLSQLIQNPTVTHIEDQTYWRDVGLSELHASLKKEPNNNVAKNVIIFIGDGMGPSTVTAARIFNGQTKDGWGEASHMSFETFPYTGISKTYNTNKQTPDSASTATALFTGVKTNQNMLGLDMQAAYNSCDSESNTRAKVQGIMTWAQERNKDTGIVTTTSVTDATPAATYSHTNNRYWECDYKIPPHLRNCVKDIARQLVEDKPGNKFKVILGGGRAQFGNTTEELTEGACRRTDGKNLVSEWLRNRTNSVFVTTGQDLSKVDTYKTEHLLGLFAPGHLNFLGEKQASRPSLPLMTSKAIEILKKNRNGFFLMVEGGRIDQAHHKNYAKLALMEAVEFSEAVSAALSLVDLEETMVIVTADHSHPFTMAGYSKRGEDILGFADKTDASFYETLTYANGPGARYHHIPISFPNCTKTNCSQTEASSSHYIKDTRSDPNRTSDVHFMSSSAVFLEDDTHGGEDVAIYAIGPKAHLFSGVHQQNFIAHAISCAACVGPQENVCCAQKFSKRKLSGGAGLRINPASFLAVLVPVALSILVG